MCRAWSVDEATLLWRELNPGRIPAAEQLQVDQVNLLHLLTVTLRQAHGDRQVKFRPLYAPPGTAWDTETGRSETKVLGGRYRTMPKADLLAWLANLPAWRGRPLPIGNNDTT